MMLHNDEKEVIDPDEDKLYAEFLTGLDHSHFDDEMPSDARNGDPQNSTVPKLDEYLTCLEEEKTYVERYSAYLKGKHESEL